jgi:hypothetical protein
MPRQHLPVRSAGRLAAQERVKNDVTPGGTIEDRIRHQRNGRDLPHWRAVAQLVAEA